MTSDHRNEKPADVKLTGETLSYLKKEIDKQVIKEAISEWLDKQFATFGKWSLRGIILMILVWAFYGWLNIQGWHK